MTHKLSNRERKLMNRARDKSSPVSKFNPIGQKGIMHEIEYTIGCVIAVFLLPFYIMIVEFKEWKDGKNRV